MTLPIQDLDRLYLGGELVDATGGSAEIINPADESVIGIAPLAGMAEVDAAIAAAREAFDQGPWPRMSGRERAQYMQRFHAALKARAERIGTILMIEAGVVRSDLQPRQYGLPLSHFQSFIELGQQDFTKVLPPAVGGAGDRKSLGTAVVTRTPMGVVSAITAYNYPFFINLSKIGPALMAGNTVVLKPSPYTPFSALILAEAALEAGLPQGVLNILNGGVDVGTAITTDPRVDMVTFTGSDTVGAKIQEQSAPTLKRLLMELGGKSAMIIRPDADEKLALQVMLRGFTAHCGQGCGMFTRLLVHNSIRRKLVDQVAEMAKAVRVGDPTDASTAMGPLIRDIARDRVERYVALGTDAGARLAVGGKRPAALTRGFFFEPTLFDDVDNDWAIAQDEIFGPVGCVIGYDTDEEAIAIANHAKFGLRAGLVTANVGLAYEMAQELRVGHVTINNGALAAMAEIPLGGMKRSGYGREGGIEGLLAYSDVRTIEFHAG